MFTQKPTTKPETLVKNMLIEDRADTMAYIREKLTLNDLRTATQNLQAVCTIVHQILSAPNPNIFDAYKIANFVATGFHDNIDIFKEIERDSIESHKGHIRLPKSLVNLDLAYCSEKLKGNKSEYLVKAISNMLDILNLTAHILSRKQMRVDNHKSLLVANTILKTAVYKPCQDIVKSTDMNALWTRIVFAAKDTIVGPSDQYITMGEHRVFVEKHKKGDDIVHHIFFSPYGVVVDGEDYGAKEMEIIDDRLYCSLWFKSMSAWLYISKNGIFGIQPKGVTHFETVGAIEDENLAHSLYRELVA